MVDKQKIKKWVENWRSASIALEQIKYNEMRSFDYSQNLPFIEDMLQWAYDHSRLRSYSGMVEQQRVFAKIKAASKSDSGRTA